jgi:nitric-oxide synthase
MTCPHNSVLAATGMAGTPGDPGPIGSLVLAHADIGAQAEAFLRQLQSERGEQGPTPDRLAEVSEEIAATGSYRHTPAELTQCAKIAWRNTPRCVGKFYWNALAVRDMRDLSNADDMFEALVEHLRLATNGGRIRLLLTAFAPDEPGRPAIRIWNSQLVRYAGCRQPDGSVIGDPAAVGFTDAVRALGWPGGSGTPFDLLPIVLQRPGEAPRRYELPPDAVLEVPIVHQDYRWFAELGLRWHAFPSISDQRMEIGGISYPAAPFSAWYTCAEIGARNLSDAGRYNVLPAVAERMGLDTSTDRSLWKDRAMLELTVAVLHSFDAAGVSIIDHHFASRQFVRHEARERAAGRTISADWELIVPPTGGSATPLWERRYDRTVHRPNFFAPPVPWVDGPVMTAGVPTEPGVAVA